MSETRAGLLLERVLRATALACFRRPVLTLLLLAALTAVSFLEVRKLKIDTDLAALLPASFRSVQDMEKLKAHFGPIGYVVVVAQNGEPEALRRFADDLTREASKLPGVTYASAKRTDSFFRDRALYYLTQEDLEEVVRRVEARAEHEKQAANPLYVDLEEETGEEPPPLQFDDLLKKYGSMKMAPIQSDGEEYYLDAKQRVLAVFIKPDLPAHDFSAATKIIEEIQELITRLDPAKYAPEMSIAIGGRYKKYQEQQAVVGEDVGLTSSIALFGIMIYLLLLFRRPGPIVMLIVPLVVGLVVSYALAGISFGKLNILTAFAGSIMAGLGVDHGIHLLHRYDHERDLGRSAEEAIALTFSNTGRGVIVAGLTTAIGFAGLSISDFKAFREFGLLAGAGVFITMITYVTGLPPLLALWAKWFKKKTARPSQPLKIVGIIPRIAPALFWISTIVLLGLFYGAPKAKFEYDFAALDGSEVPAYQLDEVVDRLVGHRQTPIVVLTEPENEALVAEALRQRVRQSGEVSTIDFVISRADLVPQDQAAKQPLLQRLKAIADKVDPASLEGSARRDFERLVRMSSAEPFGREDLPVEITRQFEPKPTKEPLGTVLAFPSIPLSDGKRVMEMAREVRDVPLPGGGTISAVAEAMILADVLELIFNDSPKVAVATAFAVLITIWILLGNFRLALICVLPPAITVAATTGAMAWLGVELNYLNIVILPVLFGMAEDAGVHMVLRGADSSESFLEAISETMRPIFGAAVTAGIGFGALLFADHPGLQSFGVVALIGLAISLFVAFFWLSGFLALDKIRRAKLADRWTDHVARGAHDLATVFGAGWSAFGGGTLGALAALPIAWGLSLLIWPAQIAVLALLTILTVAIAHVYLIKLAPAYARGEGKEPHEIVIDEWIGLLITLAFVPWSLPWIAGGFVLFRLLDIYKPGPIRWIDRNVKGAAGVILDDVAAGLAAGLLLFGVRAWTA